MEVVRILFRESPEAWKRALAVAGLAGIGNAAILGIINRGAGLASSTSELATFRLLLLFGFCMLAFYYGKRYALIQASVIVESVVKERLLRVSNKIRFSDLELIERLGRGELYTKVAQDTSLISQSGLILVNAAQQSFVLVFCLFYIAWLSKAALFATLGVIAVGVIVYMRHANSHEGLLSRLAEKEAELVDTLGHVVDGFKEIRLNRRKNDAVFRSFEKIAENARDLKVDVQISFCVDIMFSDLFFYTLLAIVVFLLPRLVPSYGSVVLMTTAAILFIIGPLQMVVQAGPVFERAKAAFNNLYELERRLDEAAARQKVVSRQPAGLYKDFQTIALEGVCFSYGNGAGFAAGPFNFRVRRGETVFVVGGNGSGKTTFLKLLTGLYIPQSGGLKVDQKLVTAPNTQEYRELFGTVFSQFHLFDRLYGLEDAGEEKVNTVLRQLELDGVTRFENGRFTELNLSTGQRKRLALAVCLLEDKEIFIFDEWAADQDPHFRKHFYEAVLQELKQRGKTIIAATHDDRFWSVADRVIRLEYGSIAEETRVA